MADTTKDIWNDDDGVQTPKKRRGARHFLTFALVLVVVLLVVLGAAYRDGTGFDALRRYLNYGSAETPGDGVYDYDAAASNRFAVLGEKLVVLSDTSLRVLGQNGEEVWSTSLNMTAPDLRTGGGRAVAYDIGGTELYVVDEAGEVFHLTADVEEPLLAATLNDQGMLTVTSKRKGLKGYVHVYGKEMNDLFGFNSSRRFVIDAYATDDGKSLAAVTLGQESGTFVSNVVLYDLTEKEPKANYDVSDGLVLAIGEQNGKLVTVSDTGLTAADTDGKTEAAYSYGGAYLREYDLGGAGFTTLLLNRYQSGSVGRLVTVGTDGKELGSLDVNREVLGLSAAGRYLAVLYIDSLVIYNENLEVYSSLKGLDGVNDVQMREDGSVLLLSSEQASLFLP